MTRALFLLALASACRNAGPSPAPAPSAPEPAPAAEQAPPEELADLFWSSVSESGTGAMAEVRQTATARNQCRATAALGSEKRWQVDECLATRRHLRFVSADALGLVVLDPLPDADGSALGRVFREGRRVAEISPASLSASSRAIQTEGGKVRWLGPRDQRVLPEGVEVELLDGSLRVLRFDRRDLPAPAVATPAAPAPAQLPECSPCSWTDSDGVYHVVENPSDVPPEYRKQAGRIRGAVQRADAVKTSAPLPSRVDPQPRPAARTDDYIVSPRPRPQDPTRNSLGENFIEYTNRIAGKPVPEADFKAKCIDNSGASVPCSETGMQAH